MSIYRGEINSMSTSDEIKDTEEAVVDNAEQTSAEPVGGSENEAENNADLQAALEEAEKKANDNWDKYVRLQAEMDNQRRRMDKQVEDAHKYAAQKFVEALLPVVDSLEMGMQADGDLDSIRQGMDLTMKQFESVMEKFKIEPINPVGEVFNPELHQAMSMQPCEDQDDNTVSAVMQKGYTLSGRLIRPAMVMVCKN
jgi:molecular chaperone GrpE